MTKEHFEEIAQAAFESLPEVFHRNFDNVHIVIEDYPSDDESMEGRGDPKMLLGLYQGIPLTHRGTWYGMSPTAPDKISLFQNNIEASCKNEEEIKRRIVEVLFHEIGHYFGMNEQQIRKAMKDYK
jgi:predicted Zn-dependent protease with MMP-like domain